LAIRKVEQGPGVALQRIGDDGAGVSVGLDDRGRIAVGRNAPDGTGDTVADVVGGRLKVSAEVELDSDVAASVAAHGRDGPDPCDPVDGGFQRFGDLRFNNVGIGADVVRGNGDDRRIHARELPYAEEREPDETEKQDQEGEYDREDRAVDAE
jgi:hypothetical protein